MTALSPELTVRRPVYQQDELDHLFKYAKPNESRKYRTRIPSERIQESWRLAKPRCLFTIRRRVIAAQYTVFRLIKGMKINDSLYKLRIEESSKEYFFAFQLQSNVFFPYCAT